MRTVSTRHTRRYAARAAMLAILPLVCAGVLSGTPAAEAAAGCRIYVASGDDYPAGNALNDNPSRFPEQLLADHLVAPGWCLYNQGKNGTTSSGYLSGGLAASAYNMRPDLHTITLGEQNSTIVNLIKSCFDKVKDHDFLGALTCAQTVQSNTTLWTSLTNNYTTILSQDKIMGVAAPRPGRRGDGVSQPLSPGRRRRRRRDRPVVRPAHRHGAHLHGALGATTGRARSDRQRLHQAQLDGQGRPRPVPSRPERVAVCLRRHQPEVRGPLHDDEGGDQDQGRASRGVRRRPPARLAGGQLRMLGELVRRGLGRHGQAPTTCCRRPPGVLIEWSQTTKGHGGLSRRGRPSVHRRCHLGGRHPSTPGRRP
jgi:hypothetical protein